jgi:hypothetical protein
MNRSQFIKGFAGVGLALKFNGLLAATQNNPSPKLSIDKIVKANAFEVAKILKSTQKGLKVLKRSLGFELANLAAAYIEKTSVYYGKEEVKTSMKAILEFIKSQQKVDGTLDLGNLSSPPDTAFIIEPICAAANLLLGVQKCDDINLVLKEILQKSGNGLAVGGLHTPNHRWVVSAALAKINHLYTDKKYTDRIEEWLSEGVYCDKDGIYLERSMTYAEVIDRSLITIATYSNKPELLALVEKNLHWVFECMESNGDLVTFASRRQDSFMKKNILHFYPQYRFMANKFNNGFMGSVAAFIETMPGFDSEIAKDLLYLFLEDKILGQNYPVTSMPDNFTKFYEGIHMLRGRKKQETFTLFGGADWPIIIASGRSTNPNLFGYRKGKAVLKHIRMSSSFFNTGYFRSQGIKKIGNQYYLNQQIEAPYYQPLPKELKQADGDYKLSQSTDGRFWNKMDFENRPKSNISKFEYKVVFEETASGKELNFEVSGTDGVFVVIELCFEKGGKLLGCETISENSDAYKITSKEASYVMGSDIIKFGPGVFEHDLINSMEGEMYSTHFGTLKTEGLHVYLTGKTPFKQQIKLS